MIFFKNVLCASVLLITAFVLPCLAISDQGWSLVQRLQEELLAQTDPAKKAALDEELAQALNALKPMSEVSEPVVVVDQEITPKIIAQEPVVTSVSERAQIVDQNHEEIRFFTFQSNVQTLDILETQYQKLEQDIADIITIYCSKKLLVFEDKILHDQVSLFLKSRLLEVRAYLDTAKNADSLDQQKMIQHICRIGQPLLNFVYCFSRIHADIIAALVFFNKDLVIWNDVHHHMIQVIYKLVFHLQKSWNEICLGEKSVHFVLYDQTRNIAHDILVPLYQTSCLKRLWSKSYLDQILTMSWDMSAQESFEELFKEYSFIITRSLIARQEHDSVVLQKELDKFHEVILKCENMKFCFIANRFPFIQQLLDNCIFSLHYLKAELEEVISTKFDYVAAPDKTEVYLAYTQVIKEPLFKTLYQRSLFKPCLAQFMSVLDLYFKTEACTVDVMYDLYSALYNLTQLKNRAAHGLLKKVVYGVKDYHLLLEQMLEILQKAYQTARAELLPPQQGIMQKLMNGEWFKKDKIKNFVSEKSGKVVVELAQKCIGQKFDTKESATVYVVSVVAPLVLLAALKYFVPNLPERIQKKVTDFIRLLPSAQDDEEELAQLIRKNPEVVEAFLKQDPQLSASLMAQFNNY